MTKTKKSASQKQLSALQVDGARRGEPLRECVRSALENYFEHLDGHSTTGLHDLVIGEVERPLLETVMSYARGNRSRAAEILGINRTTLRKKLRDYRLS